ncbi:MAG: hypothetical protein DMG06_30495 [Acidobacteria bacterium]|nr:MAG: hypothetical protein DMG06_30495 [Acidobacteriota bacterium]
MKLLPGPIFKFSYYERNGDKVKGTPGGAKAVQKPLNRHSKFFEIHSTKSWLPSVEGAPRHLPFTDLWKERAIEPRKNPS